MTVARFTADEKAAEARREATMRRSVYPGLVARGGRMTQAEADRRTALMDEIATDYERHARIEAEAREPRLELTEGSKGSASAKVGDTGVPTLVLPLSPQGRRWHIGDAAGDYFGDEDFRGVVLEIEIADAAEAQTATAALLDQTSGGDR